MEIEYKKSPGGNGYVSTNEYRYYSKRYNRWAVIPQGFWSDGATGARDIQSDAWWVHDKLCNTGSWEDGTLIDNWTASTVLGDILWRDGFKARAIWWWWATYLFGGGEARKNGMRRVNTSLG